MPPPPVPPDQAADARECFAAIARACAAEVLEAAELPGLGDEPEHLHRLRVAIRRARAALSLFRVATQENRRLPLARELRRLQRRLGAAREWDVLVDETLAALPPSLRARPAAGALVRLAEARREEGRKEVRAALHRPDSIATLRRLAAWPGRHLGAAPRGPWREDMLAAPAASVAAEVLEAHHRKAARLGRKLKRLDTPALHRLRIRVKKLRYAAEFLAPYAPGRGTKRYLAALRDLQQALGTWHDLAIAEARLAALHPAGAAPLADWLAGHEAAQREVARQAWRRFARRKRFWDRT